MELLPLKKPQQTAFCSICYTHWRFNTYSVVNFDILEKTTGASNADKLF